MSTDFTDVYLPIFDDLSKETMTTIVTINIVALVGVISMFGIACNVINILVFCKQGFSETTNISYTALAISDLLTLVTTMCLSFLWNPLFLNSGLPLVFKDIQMTFAALSYACFTNITGMVTAFATFERCMCVVWPLKLKCSFRRLHKFTVLSMFGIACNIVNILVFCKQGFSETTNISYTALAISDLLTLVATLCLSIFWNPLFLNSGLPLVFIDIQMTFASLPYACFSTITGMVTAFATFERCLCVVWPLRTLLGVTFVENTELISNTSYILHSALQLVAFFAVLLFTVTLIVCLRQMTAWRILQSKTQNAAKKATKRQDKAIKMITLIAATYVATFFPTIIGLVVTVPYPSFGPTGRYKNIFFAVWSLSILFSVVNSSTNLFVYYVMSSKFRLTCYQMLSRLL
ncbi:unnamed protein product [Candidula unifasciata]|uniref:G-protein coupled receptors family 1 profile domain-containing protein n=1 Tax=Candidula unifasciata TaxID=100452 RepID=A0A8S3ZQY5_9EUPU|nr:unnamed protein product [Candidula unifasciata]